MTTQDLDRQMTATVKLEADFAPADAIYRAALELHTATEFPTRDEWKASSDNLARLEQARWDAVSEVSA
jgi:hypothetical protein